VTSPAEEIAERLAKACVRHLDWAVTIEGVRRLAGGASQETWSFDAVLEGGTTPLILRRNQRGYGHTLPSATEFALLRAAHAGTVPVPEALFVLDERDGLGQGYVMRRAEGEAIPRRILRDDPFATARDRMTAQLGHILADIHRLDLGAVPDFPRLPPGTTAAAAQRDQYRAIMDGIGEPHPTFELALRWLTEHEPPPLAPTLVHGDFRLGNFLVGPTGIQAILDWELAHEGDPAEDLGWLCVPSWRFGNEARVVGGFGDLEDLLAAYTAAGGAPIDRQRVEYWVVFGTLKWGVICEVQAFTHRSGLARSVELAAIGRRVCETEWDLLQLMT